MQTFTCVTCCSPCSVRAPSHERTPTLWLNALPSSATLRCHDFSPLPRAATLRRPTFKPVAQHYTTISFFHQCRHSFSINADVPASWRNTHALLQWLPRTRMHVCTGHWYISSTRQAWGPRIRTILTCRLLFPRPRNCLLQYRTLPGDMPELSCGPTQGARLRFQRCTLPVSLAFDNVYVYTCSSTLAASTVLGTSTFTFTYAIHVI